MGQLPIASARRAANANAEVRAREYLTDGEIARLIDAAGKNRYGPN